MRKRPPTWSICPPKKFATGCQKRCRSMSKRWGTPRGPNTTELRCGRSTFSGRGGAVSEQFYPPRTHLSSRSHTGTEAHDTSGGTSRCETDYADPVVIRSTSTPCSPTISNSPNCMYARVHRDTASAGRSPGDSSTGDPNAASYCRHRRWNTRTIARGGSIAVWDS